MRNKKKGRKFKLSSVVGPFFRRIGLTPPTSPTSESESESSSRSSRRKGDQAIAAETEDSSCEFQSLSSATVPLSRPQHQKNSSRNSSSTTSSIRRKNMGVGVELLLQAQTPSHCVPASIEQQEGEGGDEIEMLLSSAPWMAQESSSDDSDYDDDFDTETDTDTTGSSWIPCHDEVEAVFRHALQQQQQQQDQHYLNPNPIDTCNSTCSGSGSSSGSSAALDLADQLLEQTLSLEQRDSENEESDDEAFRALQAMIRDYENETAANEQVVAQSTSHDDDSDYHHHGIEHNKDDDEQSMDADEWEDIIAQLVPSEEETTAVAVGNEQQEQEEVNRSASAEDYDEHDRIIRIPILDDPERIGQDHDREEAERNGDVPAVEHAISTLSSTSTSNYHDDQQPQQPKQQSTESQQNRDDTMNESCLEVDALVDIMGNKSTIQENKAVSLSLPQPATIQDEPEEQARETDCSGEESPVVSGIQSEMPKDTSQLPGTNQHDDNDKNMQALIDQFNVNNQHNNMVPSLFAKESEEEIAEEPDAFKELQALILEFNNSKDDSDDALEEEEHGGNASLVDESIDALEEKRTMLQKGSEEKCDSSIDTEEPVSSKALPAVTPNLETCDNIGIHSAEAKIELSTLRSMLLKNYDAPCTNDNHNNNRTTSEEMTTVAIVTPEKEAQPRLSISHAQKQQNERNHGNNSSMQHVEEVVAEELSPRLVEHDDVKGASLEDEASQHSCDSSKQLHAEVNLLSLLDMISKYEEECPSSPEDQPHIAIVTSEEDTAQPTVSHAEKQQNGRDYSDGSRTQHSKPTLCLVEHDDVDGTSLEEEASHHSCDSGQSHAEVDLMALLGMISKYEDESPGTSEDKPDNATGPTHDSRMEEESTQQESSCQGPTLRLFEYDDVKEASFEEEASHHSCDSEQSHAEVNLLALLGMISKYKDECPSPDKPDRTSDDSRIEQGSPQKESSCQDANRQENNTALSKEKMSKPPSESSNNPWVVLQEMITSREEEDERLRLELKNGAALKSAYSVEETMRPAEVSAASEKAEMDIAQDVTKDSDQGSFQDQLLALKSLIASNEEKQQEESNNLGAENDYEVASSIIEEEKDSESSSNDDKEVLEDAAFSPIGKSPQEKTHLLIRELQHIQTHGPNMFESIEHKIKSWCHHEVKLQAERKEKRLSLPIGLSLQDKNQLIIRELQHIQTHGPNMFESIEEKIVSWHDHEVKSQVERKNKRLSLPVLPTVSAGPRDSHLATDEATSKNFASRRASDYSMATKPKSTNLIRELQFVQKQGADIFESIDKKVETWQRTESQRHLLVARAQDTQVAVADAVSNCEAESTEKEGKERFAALDEKAKSRQESTLRTSEHTESTHSCSETGSGCAERLRTSRQNGRAMQQRAGTTQPNHSGDCNETEFSVANSNSSMSWCPSHVFKEKNESAGVTTVVDKVFQSPPAAATAATVEHRNATIRHDIETITVEVTVHSSLRSLASDEEEWTVMDSLEDKENIFECFDFENLEEECVGEEYGVIGFGVSDDISVISDLTTPIDFEAMEPSPHLQRRLRKVAPLPRKAARKRELPFQQVKLKRSFTNPSRLPQMKHAARLLMYRQQLKPAGADKEEGQQVGHASRRRRVGRSFTDRPSKGNYSEVKLKRSFTNPSRLPQMKHAAHLLMYPQQLKPVDAHAPRRKRVGRSFSDKPPKSNYSKVVKHAACATNAKSSARQQVMSSDAKCILDFDWDDLDDMGNDNAAASGYARTESPKKRAEECQPPSCSRYPSPARVTSNQIGKTDSYYHSVSVSFLASSIRDKTIVEVVEEALRILRPGGILNVLDMNGSAMNRIQVHPEFGFLAFQRATVKDQEHLETNTLSILEKSGLRTRFDVADPRIVHWKAIKQARN